MSAHTTMHRHLRRLFVAALLLAGTSAGAMPIHIANVYPSDLADATRFDVAIGTEIVARDLGYRDVVSVDGWPGPNAITLYRAGSTTPIATGFIAPPPSTPISALERGYTVLVAENPESTEPMVLVSEDAPVSVTPQAMPVTGPAYLSFATPTTRSGLALTPVTFDCEFRQPSSFVRQRITMSYDARVGRSYRVLPDLDLLETCNVIITLPSRQPLVVSDLQAQAGRTLRLVVVGDGERRPLEVIVLQGGQPQPVRRGLDPLGSIHANSLWMAAGRAGTGYIGGDPSTAAAQVGFLLLADGSGQARWLLLVMGEPSADGLRAVDVLNATRPVGEPASTSSVGSGTARRLGCNQFELELTIGETTTRYDFVRSVPRGDCPTP